MTPGPRRPLPPHSTQPLGAVTSRRTALVALAALTTAACSREAEPPEGGGAPSSSSPAPAPESTPTPSTSPPPAPSASPAVPAVVPFALLPGEVEPACKQAALDAAAAALTVDAAVPEDLATSTDLVALGQAPAPLAPLRALVPAGSSAALEVAYPQYGGLDAARRSASVMLVGDLLVSAAPGGATAATAPERRSTTVDLRLARSADRWTVTEVLVPALPAPLPPEQLSAPTRELLASDRVVLPGAARADLLAGGVLDVVSQVLLELSRTWRLHVQVLTSGHPTNVFATDRVSNHTRGRAVDLWALDGVPVVDQQRCPWREVVEAATALGASEVGGPQDLGGPGQFTDPVHQDHLHLGFGRA